MSAIATGHPLPGPTLLICMYVHGYSEVSSTTREATLPIAEEDLTAYLGENTGSVIIAGDLNTSAEQMEVEAVNGSLFFEYLLQINRTRNATTCHHLNGTREIDFILSDAPLQDVRLDTPNIRRLSDHDVVCCDFAASTNELTALIPDRELAREVYERVTSGRAQGPRDQLELVRQFEQDGRPTMKRVTLTELWQRRVDR